VTRAGAATVAVALLGVGCSEAARRDGATPEPRPRCEARPGRGVEGFALHRAREITYRDHVARRLEYRDARGRRLFYLLGVVGETGEGPGEFEPVTLVDGTPATFFGRRDAWGVFWRDEPPCPQMAVIGNGFRRKDFIDLAVEARILSDESGFRLLPYETREWVAVFRTADGPDPLRTDTDLLLELAPGHLVVGPVGCHEGLAAELDLDEASYFSGVVGKSRSELRTVLEVVRMHPRFDAPPLAVGEFRILCGL
jgi:hypothetical protein